MPIKFGVLVLKEAAIFQMTSRLTILILFVSFETFSQDNVAIINDKDGFTNVRESKLTNSAIVGQIKKGEFFTFKTSTGNWLEISKTFNENGEIENLHGFVHKSRVQPVSTLSDKIKRELIEDKEANAFLKRKYRKGWDWV